VKLNDEYRATLEATLPSSKEVQRRLREYLERSNLSHNHFAHLARCSGNAVRAFLNDRYAQLAETDLLIRKRIVDTMAAYPVEVDVEVAGRLHETANVVLLRKYIYAARDHGRAYWVQGDPGSQKTYTALHLIAEMNRQELARNGRGRRAYYVYCCEGVRPLDLLKDVADAIGCPATGGRRAVVKMIRLTLRRRPAVIVFDEAQHLDVPCIDRVRVLLDLQGVGMVFMGSHELEHLFLRNAVRLEQWNSRFNAGATLPGITEQEASRILLEELGADANRAVIGEAIAGARVPHLRQKPGRKNAEKYISARRLFNAIRDFKAAAEGAGPA
jgi:DNA transposition AAA+ family ATPase